MSLPHIKKSTHGFVALSSAENSCTTQEERMACRCFGISEAHARKLVKEKGINSLSELKKQTGAGGGCSACHCGLERLLNGKSLQTRFYDLFINGSSVEKSGGED